MGAFVTWTLILGRMKSRVTLKILVISLVKTWKASIIRRIVGVGSISGLGGDVDCGVRSRMLARRPGY